jgi:hypothetical protein
MRTADQLVAPTRRVGDNRYWGAVIADTATACEITSGIP